MLSRQDPPTDVVQKTLAADLVADTGEFQERREGHGSDGL